MLASKYDEIDKKIPFYKEFIKASSRAAKYTVKEYHKAEDFFVKEVLLWRFHTITSLHFTYCLTTQGILFEDDEYDGDESKILKSLNKKAELFTDLSLDSGLVLSSSCSKSLIAVTCVVASRRIWGIKPLWNNKLYNLTNYHFFDIKDLLEILIREYCAFFNEDYSKIMHMPEQKKSRAQNRPQSFIERRCSEKPRNHPQLTHINSTKSLKVGERIKSQCFRNTLGHEISKETVVRKSILSNGWNADMKSIKLDACDGDTFSSSLSIPDENDTEMDTCQEFSKVNEKCLTRWGTNDTQESEPIKIYVMRFKSMTNQEAKSNVSA